MQKLKILLSFVLALVLRNRIVFRDLKSRTKRNTVNVHWWQNQGNVQNVGDYLSVVVVEYMKKRYNLKDMTPKTHHLYAIGSIISFGYQDTTIWGSGLIYNKENYWWSKWRKLDIRCVRGPKTREVLLKNGYDCPENYGDPAILMPLIYQPYSCEKKYEYTVVHHHFHLTGSEDELSPLTNDWQGFIDRLVQSKLVISSSLHGIILAEAYRVPAIMLKEEGLDIFKFEDYYNSTGRVDFPIAENVEQALQMTPSVLPDFKKLQDNLIETFPVDLWN